jgi:hypothetical protein
LPGTSYRYSTNDRMHDAHCKQLNSGVFIVLTTLNYVLVHSVP